MRVVLALGADNVGDLKPHHLVHDAQPDTVAQRHQPLPRCPDELAERLLDLHRQQPLRRTRGLKRTTGRDDRGHRYLLKAVPPVSDGVDDRPPGAGPGDGLPGAAKQRVELEDVPS